MSVTDAMTAAIVAKFIFFPVKAHDYLPSQLETPYEEVFFKNEEGLALHGWFFVGKKDRTLLYLHGNAGNIGDRVDKIRFLKGLGWNIFAFDYRGYGLSQGSPTIEGVLEDSRAALHYLTEKIGIPNEQIVLLGESLGGAMAVDLAHAEPVAAVILESTFTTLRDLAHEVYRFLPSGVAPDVYRSIDLIRHIKAPVLVIHGAEDEIVSFSMGKKLFEAAPHPKRFFSVPGAHHNDVYEKAGKDYLREIEEFFSAAGIP
jgi:fermentation-respiration switch protein FrsA (DUF1100 family)